MFCKWMLGRKIIKKKNCEPSKLNRKQTRKAAEVKGLSPQSNSYKE